MCRPAVRRTVWPIAETRAAGHSELPWAASLSSIKPFGQFDVATVEDVRLGSSLVRTYPVYVRAG